MGFFWFMVDGVSISLGWMVLIAWGPRFRKKGAILLPEGGTIEYEAVPEPRIFEEIVQTGYFFLPKDDSQVALEELLEANDAAGKDTRIEEL